MALRWVVAQSHKSSGAKCESSPKCCASWKRPKNPANLRRAPRCRLLRIAEEQLVAVRVIDHKEPVTPLAILDRNLLGFELRAPRIQRRGSGHLSVDCRGRSLWRGGSFPFWNQTLEADLSRRSRHGGGSSANPSLPPCFRASLFTQRRGHAAEGPVAPERGRRGGLLLLVYPERLSRRATCSYIVGRYNEPPRQPIACKLPSNGRNEPQHGSRRAVGACSHTWPQLLAGNSQDSRNESTTVYQDCEIRETVRSRVGLISARRI